MPCRAVPGRGVAQRRRVNGTAGVGQATLRGRLADVGREVFEPGRGGDLQDAQRLVGADQEGVRPAFAFR